MDLTPPSLTTSPYSPQRKSIDSPPPFAYGLPEASSVNYTTLTALDNHPYNIPPPYGSLIDPLLSDQGVDGNTHLTSLDAMASTGHWNSHSVTAAGSPEGSTTSTMPHVLTSSEYDQFNAYEQPCLPPSTYSTTTVATYGRPTPQHSPAFVHTPPPSTADIPGRDQTAFAASHRSSFSFPAEQPVSKPDVTNAIQYGTLDHDPSFTPPSRALHPRLPPGYIQELQHPQPQLHAGPFPPQLAAQPASQLPLSRTKDDPKLRPGDHRYVRQRVKPKRHIRKHTTQEEANFQCKVKGCGKYFSRSYNFKSHMETHDDKRPYPFPCEEPNCTKKFVRKTDLQRHHQSVHTKERNHKCDYCGRLFARKDTLRR